RYANLSKTLRGLSPDDCITAAPAVHSRVVSNERQLKHKGSAHKAEPSCRFTQPPHVVAARIVPTSGVICGSPENAQRLTGGEPLCRPSKMQPNKGCGHYSITSIFEVYSRVVSNGRHLMHKGTAS